MEKCMDLSQTMEVNMEVDKEKMASYNMKMVEGWNHQKSELINHKITNNQH